MHAAVDFDRNTQFANREIHGEAADLMLSHHMHAFIAQQAQGLPRVMFGSAHAAAVFGAVSARRISQAPAMIIGIESSMPIVT